MKNIKLYLLLIFMILSPSLFSAATYNRNVTATQLATQIQGKGITITNPVITRGQIGTANSQVATFTNGLSGANLQIDEGILLTASTADEAFSTNDSGRKSRNPGNINNVGSLPTFDADLLTTISQNSIFNQVVFEFDVTLDNNTRLLLVDYQFASDEYPEWVGSKFNDAFGFFISGGNLSQTYNIARVVDDSTIVTTANISNYPPVNINNVNNGSVGSQSTGQPVDLTNSSFFIDNGGTNTGTGGLNPSNIVITSEFDGFTKKLHATLDNLTPGQTYHFKMALADTSDSAWDAGVFVNKIIGVRVPSVCYDYDVRVGNDITVPSTNNDITATAYPGEQLNLGIVIQSLEGELPLEDMNLTVLLNPNNNLHFNNAQISPDSINAYVPIPDAFVKKVPYAQIPIGEHLTSSGGIISANQVIFSNLTYDFNGSSSIDTHFDLNSSLKLNLNGIIIERSISTRNGTLTRCPTQTGYHPIWAFLNIERHNSQNGLPAEQHVLYTQISNRPFDVDVVSYDPNSTSAPQAIEDVTVEVEIIDAGKYTESNQSIFTCKEPSSIEPGQFVKFDSLTSRVEVQNFSTPRALQNAAFRLWYLVDQNNTLIKHNCPDANNPSCFRTLYNNQFFNKIDTSPYKCRTQCSNNSGCYECLKMYFAKPICSRDNFAIRPAAYRISLHDNDDSNVINAPQVFIGKNNNAGTIFNLAAGYNYVLEGNATQFGSDDNVTGYYATFTSTTGPDLTSQFVFNTSGTCRDQNDTDINIVFHRGKIQYSVDATNTIQFASLNRYNHNNVGNYLYHIEDNNWTIVDQRRYPFKTFPDTEDCINTSGTAKYAISSDGDSKSGCGISSSLTYGSNTYVDVPLRFHPYSFNLTNLNLNVPTGPANYIYTNNLNTKDLLALYMSANFIGDVVAEAKGGTRVSNFTAGCVASPVIFDINRTMTQDNNVSINENNIYGKNLDDSTTLQIRFQRQYLNSAANPSYQVENNDTNGTTAITILASEFTDDANGSAHLSLYYNFTKPQKHVMNPINIWFAEKRATAPQEISFADMRSDYVASGQDDINRSIDFYYGRIVASQDIYTIPDNRAFQTVPLFIEAYCNNNELNCSRHRLTFTSIRGSEPWLVNTIHSSPRGDGLISSFTDPKGVGNLNISPATLINLNNDGNWTDVNFTIPNTTPRPYRTKIEVNPDRPWLDYNPDNPRDLPDFILYFQGGGGWAGKGNTGMVVETNASYESVKKRLEW